MGAVIWQVRLVTCIGLALALIGQDQDVFPCRNQYKFDWGHTTQWKNRCHLNRCRHIQSTIYSMQNREMNCEKKNHEYRYQLSIVIVTTLFYWSFVLMFSKVGYISHSLAPPNWHELCICLRRFYPQELKHFQRYNMRYCHNGHTCTSERYPRDSN